MLRATVIALLLVGPAMTARAQTSPSLTGLYGLGIPAYDRTDGLSLPIGAAIDLWDGRLRVEPHLTYRSQLGRLDPSLTTADSLGRGRSIGVTLGRSTYTNDAWIRGDLLNSLSTFGIGDDVRNYYRATRAQAAFNWETDSVDDLPDGATRYHTYVGVRAERASSVRPGANATGGPWSFIGHHDTDDILRPNPAVDDGVTNSVVAGTDVHWTAGDIVSHVRFDVEVGAASTDPSATWLARSGNAFGQATLGGSVSYPTFGQQSVRFDGHLLVSSRGSTPRQRWSYLGGSGTLPTLELLSLGGDELVFIDGRYNIPITHFDIPMLGAPVLSLHDAIGGAAVDEFPTLHQNLGLQLGLGPVYVDFLVDPATRAHQFGVGISIAY